MVKKGFAGLGYDVSPVYFCRASRMDTCCRRACIYEIYFCPVFCLVVWPIVLAPSPADSACREHFSLTSHRLPSIGRGATLMAQSGQVRQRSPHMASFQIEAVEHIHAATL